MDRSSLPPSRSEPAGQSNFDVKTFKSHRHSPSFPIDYEQPISAERSTIRREASHKEREDASKASPSPCSNLGVESTPSSNNSTRRFNRFGRLMMDRHPPAEPSRDASSTSSYEDSTASDSDDDEASQSPKPKRRRPAQAIPFKPLDHRGSTSTASSTPTIKIESVETDFNMPPPPHIDNSSNASRTSSTTLMADPIIIKADDLEQAFFGAAQVFNYRGPRNPISRHMKFPEEEEESADEEKDGKAEVKEKAKKVMWTENWWSELHEVNGVEKKPWEEGNNLVRERSRKLGGNKRG